MPASIDILGVQFVCRVKRDASTMQSRCSILYVVSGGGTALTETVIWVTSSAWRAISRSASLIRGLLTQIHPALERVLGPPPGATRQCWTCWRDTLSQRQ